ncbi:MAG: phospholipase D-like domain-containing protein [Granulosicoccaceae bacterium]|jgi:phosphatidylserine/phosphatidylglycerophosphate/cardiolipin synthase-like enzyme
MPDRHAYKRNLFPWRDGNHVTLHVDGVEFLSHMLADIEQARHEILFEMYLIKSGQTAQRFVSALVAASRRGVRVYALLDAFGSRLFSTADRAQLQQAGVHLALYRPVQLGQWRNNFARDHRKILVVDGQRAWTGGSGISDEFDAQLHGDQAWRETMIAVTGPVVRDMQQLFAHSWQKVCGEQLVPRRMEPLITGTMRARLQCMRGIFHRDLQREIMRHIQIAQHRIWISTAYFVPSVKLRRILKRAARRGVDVRLLLPGSYTDHPAVRHVGHRYYARLMRAGIRIFEYTPRTLHSKALLCDDMSSIGSSNFDQWTSFWNLEANLAVVDASFAGALANMFEVDFADSREIDLQVWLARPWWKRMREYFWGGVRHWASRFQRGRFKE